MCWKNFLNIIQRQKFQWRGKIHKYKYLEKIFDVETKLKWVVINLDKSQKLFKNEKLESFCQKFNFFHF